MAKIANCARCTHRLICEWCAENTNFKFPQPSGTCDMCNTDFDDTEEAVTNACAEAKRMMDKTVDDRVWYMFHKGRWAALKDVLAFMAERGHYGKTD